MNYLALFETDGDAHGGLVPELNVSAVGKSPAQVRERLTQGIALALLDYAEAGRGAPVPEFRTFDDLPAELQKDFAGAGVEHLAASPINPVSLEIERAVQRSGLSDSELARRMGSSPAAVGRLQDYFYWGHSLATLRKLADALGMHIEVKLTAA